MQYTQVDLSKKITHDIYKLIEIKISDENSAKDRAD